MSCTLLLEPDRMVRRNQPFERRVHQRGPFPTGVGDGGRVDFGAALRAAVPTAYSALAALVQCQTMKEVRRWSN